MSERRFYFKLSPELGDGSSYEIVERIDTPIMSEKLKLWADEMGTEPGESIIIEVVEMDVEEFDRLPQL